MQFIYHINIFYVLNVIILLLNLFNNTIYNNKNKNININKNIYIKNNMYIVIRR